ncbi:MAG TPA: hypothetical protein VGN64_21315, partial [Dyadobacter sp.]|nr:hypothetical protein [Dyadobacter sp.]
RESRLNLQLAPKAVDLDEVMVYNSAGDRTWLARLFVSSRLREQSRNIGKFFVALPYQASLTPGLGTHGRMSGQVTNKFSMNLLGGYTAGVNGVEIAGGFNISKNNVRVAQIAGIFNVVAGSVQGVQVAGFHNHVLDSLSGVQLSGFGNLVNKEMRGVQIGGFFNVAGTRSKTDSVIRAVQIAAGVNYVRSSIKGAQITGAVNIARHDFAGAQISGILNVASQKASGLQLAPINYARHLKGVQIGVVNVADSSSGFSFGLINIVKHGKGAVSVYANESAVSNISWKTGTNRLYSILSIGADWRADRKAYIFGYGLGTEFKVNKGLSAGIELSTNNAYTGNIDSMPGIIRFQALLNLHLNKRLLLSAGPAVSVMTERQTDKRTGFAGYPPKSSMNFGIGKLASGWIGWQFGLVYEYGKLL